MGAVVLLSNAVDCSAYDDSKVLSEQQRDHLYGVIRAQQGVKRSVGMVDHEFIDRRGIIAALRRSTMYALWSLFKKVNMRLVGRREFSISELRNVIRTLGKENIELIIDGNHDFGLKHLLGVRVTTIIDGDAQVKEIGMASIVAKVERDLVMKRMHRLYPQRNFKKHKGYGTSEHCALIKECGLSPIHRKSFLTKLIQNNPLF